MRNVNAQGPHRPPDCKGGRRNLGFNEPFRCTLKSLHLLPPSEILQEVQSITLNHPVGFLPDVLDLSLFSRKQWLAYPGNAVWLWRRMSLFLRDSC